MSSTLLVYIMLYNIYIQKLEFMAALNLVPPAVLEGTYAPV